MLQYLPSAATCGRAAAVTAKSPWHGGGAGPAPQAHPPPSRPPASLPASAPHPADPVAQQQCMFETISMLALHSGASQGRLEVAATSLQLKAHLQGNDIGRVDCQRCLECKPSSRPVLQLRSLQNKCNQSAGCNEQTADGLLSMQTNPVWWSKVHTKFLTWTPMRFQSTMSPASSKAACAYSCSALRAAPPCSLSLAASASACISKGHTVADKAETPHSLRVQPDHYCSAILVTAPQPGCRRGFSEPGT